MNEKKIIEKTLKDTFRFFEVLIQRLEAEAKLMETKQEDDYLNGFNYCIGLIEEFAATGKEVAEHIRLKHIGLLEQGHMFEDLNFGAIKRKKS